MAGRFQRPIGVGVTYTHNLPTDDAQKGLNFMAYTARHSNLLKQQTGVSTRGRKAELGPVYSYSLAWRQDQTPDEKTMIDAALDSLSFLKLDQEYQAVFVQHTETDHDHIHVIVNLVSPVNGKTGNVGNDQVRLSAWAEEYERTVDKEISCEQRVENNEKRRQLQIENKGKAKEDPDRQLGVVKHREQKIDRDKIQELYQQSDSAKAFEAALKDSGYELAKGDRRGLVLVDDTGKVYSLSRQLKGLWTKDKETGRWIGGLEEKFSDFDEKSLPKVKDLVEDRQYYDRDKQNQEQQERVEQAAIDHERKKLQVEKENRLKEKDQEKQSENPYETVQETQPIKAPPKHEIVHPAYEHYDRLLEQERKEHNKRLALQEKLNKYYGREKIERDLQTLRDKVLQANTNVGRMTGRHRKLLEQVEAKEKELVNINERMNEQFLALEKELEKKRIEHEKPSEPDSKVVDLEAEKDRRREEFKVKSRERQEQKDHNRSRDQDQGYEL